jgi:hypothetical protein
MVYVPVQCPHCQSTEGIKAGKSVNGTQRYRCHNEHCARRIFLLHYQDRGLFAPRLAAISAMGKHGGENSCVTFSVLFFALSCREARAFRAAAGPCRLLP